MGGWGFKLPIPPHKNVSLYVLYTYKHIYTHAYKHTGAEGSNPPALHNKILAMPPICT